MSSVLAQLIDTSSDSMAGSFLADEFTLAKTTSLIRQLARYRFVHLDERLGELTALCASVDAVRGQRNLFVHGQWVFDPKSAAEGQISVLESKWKEDKKDKAWSRAKVHVFTESNLTELRNKIGALVVHALAINERMSPEEMMPHWQEKKAKGGADDRAR